MGNIVFVTANINISSCTGTGNVLLGGFPFTIKNQLNGNSVGSIALNNNWIWPTGTTSIAIDFLNNTTTAQIICSGSAIGFNFLQIANSVNQIIFSGFYQI